jgi:hypothetical protein
MSIGCTHADEEEDEDDLAVDEVEDEDEVTLHDRRMAQPSAWAIRATLDRWHWPARTGTLAETKALYKGAMGRAGARRSDRVFQN